MLLSGTTCDCETNLVVAPDRLAEKYQLICVDYSGFDGNNLIFPDMITVMEKIEGMLCGGLLAAAKKIQSEERT